MDLLESLLIFGRFPKKSNCNVVLEHHIATHPDLVDFAR
jgi:hypothetical protein